MKKFIGFWVILSGVFFISTQMAPSSSVTMVSKESSRVILVTIDGVRREELSGNLDLDLDPRVKEAYDPMPFFNQTLRKLGTTIGTLGSESIMTVANTEMISLPAYMSIMAGRPQPCFSNECGSIFFTRPLTERLTQELKWDRKDVAVIASWENIKYAVESAEGNILVSAGPTVVDLGDDEQNRLQEAAKGDLPPWAHARWDSYTMELAREYWRKNQPKFLYVALNDTDEWGHKGQYLEHLQALTNIDHFLDQLVNDVIEQDRRDQQRTCLLITTDHGRGLGQKWTTHSNGALYSGLIWAYATCHLAKDLGHRAATEPEPREDFLPKSYSHLDIRPTLETWLGLTPRTCLLCGHPIEPFL